MNEDDDIDWKNFLKSVNPIENKTNYFKVKKISDCGNLKYSTSSNKILESKKNFSKIFFNNKIWCASSTHFNEEEICAQIHVQLKKKINN